MSKEEITHQLHRDLQPLTEHVFSPQEIAERVLSPLGQMRAILDNAPQDAVKHVKSRLKGHDSYDCSVTADTGLHRFMVDTAINDGSKRLQLRVSKAKPLVISTDFPPIEDLIIQWDVSYNEGNIADIRTQTQPFGATMNTEFDLRIMDTLHRFLEQTYGPPPAEITVGTDQVVPDLK